MFGFRSQALRIISISVLLLAPTAAWTQEDPDPNSPTPVLLSQNDSTRALTTLPGTIRTRSSRSRSDAFAAGSYIEIFFTNVALLEGETENAFRVYATDAKGRDFRFAAKGLREVKEYPGVYGLTIRLKDEIGFWDGPADGDVLLRLTWRGLSSNQVKLGYNKTGGDLKELTKSFPTPLGGKYGSYVTVDNAIGYRWSGDRMRFLEQAAFGPTSALDLRIRRIGLRTWLAEQFDAPYPSIENPYPNIPLMPVNVSTDCGNNIPTNCVRDHYTMYPVQTWFYREAFYGEPQLRHRVAWALSQIWVIASPDTQQSSWMLEYHQQLSGNAFGNWRDLMYDITLNPGMGNYLDMIRSTRTNPNENYPREILQLFNIGLFMLNPDGTQQLDPQGDPIPTYDQNTVNNFTKVFTGWRDCRPADLNANCPDASPNGPDFKDPMSLNPANHDLTAKTLLTYPGSTTTNIAACPAPCTDNNIRYTYAYNSLNQALDNIYEHPNVAPFVSKMLIQHLVTSDPTPAYVGRISAVFNANRTSPTQLKEVVKAILLDPEARGDVKTDPHYGKLREPVQLLTNVLRNFNVGSADQLTRSDGNVNRFLVGLGQDAFRSPTVFNYYSPDYVVPGTTLLAPEFNIYTTGTSIGRANLMNTFVFNRVNVSLPDTPNGTSISLAELQAVAAADTSSNQLMDVLNQRMMHGTMSASMRENIRTAVNVVVSTNTLQRAQTAVYLVATSSQFQVQR